MKTTYYCTWALTNEKSLKKVIRLILLDDDKNLYDSKPIREIIYTGVTAWEIIKGGGEARQIESAIDESSTDPHHEYLVLYFNDGTSATYRNSFCDMFIEF